LYWIIGSFDILVKKLKKPNYSINNKEIAYRHKTKNVLFLHKTRRIIRCNLSRHPAGTVSKSSSFKCRAKRDIPSGICGEESATAACFLRTFLIALTDVIPSCPIAIHVTP
jgi:hypothetical protein